MTDKDLDRLFQIVKEAEADELPDIVATIEREQLRRQLADISKNPVKRWIVSASVDVLSFLGRVREAWHDFLAWLDGNTPPGGAA